MAAADNDVGLEKEADKLRITNSEYLFREAKGCISLQLGFSTSETLYRQNGSSN
jgi:hypothetical protein